MKKRISDLVLSLVIYWPLRVLPPTGRRLVGSMNRGLSMEKRMWPVGLLKGN